MSAGRGRSNFWSGEAHEALAMALARMHGTIKPDQQAAIVKDMKDSGFETTWEVPLIYFINFTLVNPLDIFISPLRHTLLTNHTLSQTPAITMASSTKKWDDTKLAHLFLSIYDAVEIPFTKENKDTIVATMNQRFGHDVNWNGIR
ncbi:hypothetical protein GQX73_g6456 [Xylaria multiplex]|uniref:Uncharacterized protein n=1 Tax=Xylaria multiplex TaxID=323545 RepID=A0A7C8MRU3_9PEZI|nr:hypothetical protein GQX73_g6456 [Xylaria multiplex]